jgi:hypothetical protein
MMLMYFDAAVFGFAGTTQSSSSSPPPSPFITSTEPLPVPSVSFSNSSSATSESETPSAPEAPASPPAVLLPTASGACPARLLTLLQEQPRTQQQQQPPQTVESNKTKNGTTHSDKDSQEFKQQQQQQASQKVRNQQQQQQQLSVWPPEPLRSGLTCTMEVSHLAVAMPGSADVCSAFRIKNNLMSALYSWQLVWEPGAAGGLLAAGADGAVAIASDPGACVNKHMANV